MPVVILTFPSVTLSSNTIPLSSADARFASNTSIVGGVGTRFTSGVLSNKDINDNPLYNDTNPCCFWDGSSNPFTMSKCRIDWREGPRIDANTGTFNMDQCYVNCIGFTVDDHADAVQAFNPTGSGIFNVTNTCFRCYSDAEALATYGSCATGSDSMQWADGFQGTVNYNNVLIFGGARGMLIFADAGTTHVSFNNVYFAPVPNGSSWPFYDYDIGQTAGTMIIDQWTNVFAATVVNGVIIPGAALPKPPF